MISSLLFRMSRDLDIRCVFWKDIFPNSKFQFFCLSRLTAKFGSNFDLEILLNFLQSCPKIESLILMIWDQPRVYSEDREANEMSSTVPPCLVSSLKFVELIRPISEYEGKMILVGYFLKNSTILEKLTLRLCDCNSIEANDVTRKEILAMPRCSTTCEVLVL
ncbi:unnamed protein product [Thlaspi arvense]|uniref:FBD domain-containing protein n=1 Tax=Thlaspi arvense TaxID=13288 RepID=A0AAU9RWG6_THLAR|nr:unnamed protein product [Thlaspi arvense]